MVVSARVCVPRTKVMRAILVRVTMDKSSVFRSFCFFFFIKRQRRFFAYLSAFKQFVFPAIYVIRLNYPIDTA